MARLKVDEIDAIEAAVKQMTKNLEAGRLALRFNSVDRTLLGAKLSTDPDTFNDVCLDVSAIRACYYWHSQSINLTGKTWYTGQKPNAATLNAFHSWMTAVLAHEVCHVLQHRQEPDRFKSGGEAEKAKELSYKAKCTGLPADYVAYVSCSLEFEAHATQLAAELRSQGQLSHDEFRAAAKKSDLMKHVRSKSTSPDGDPWREWDWLETSLIDEAWKASEVMWGR